MTAAEQGWGCKMRWDRAVDNCFGTNHRALEQTWPDVGGRTRALDQHSWWYVHTYIDPFRRLLDPSSQADLSLRAIHGSVLTDCL